jgi:hypothetical protein
MALAGPAARSDKREEVKNQQEMDDQQEIAEHRTSALSGGCCRMNCGRALGA